MCEDKKQTNHETEAPRDDTSPHLESMQFCFQSWFDIVKMTEQQTARAAE